MIHTSKQLKDKVRNISHGDNDMAKMLIRNFMMERFLERISMSKYHDRFVLKGGLLVASLIGTEIRATMDIDATVRAIPLNEEESKDIIEEIRQVPVEDGIEFNITKVSPIMDGFEYPGVRISLEGRLERMKQIIKIDISTDDIITPSAIEYHYPLMFEDRTISLMTYNIETLLAEKIQTILARGIANTRLRDFYDIYSVMNILGDSVDKMLLKEAFRATCRKRETVFEKLQIEEMLSKLRVDEHMRVMWSRYKERNYFVGDLEWDTVIGGVCDIIREHIAV